MVLLSVLESIEKFPKQFIFSDDISGILSF